MIFNNVAHNYALALSRVAGVNLEQAEEDLHAIRDALRADDKFAIFVQSPSISRATKQKAFSAALNGKVQKSVLNLCLILVEKRRMQFLPDIFGSFRKIVDDMLGRTYVDITVAKNLNTGESPLDEEVMKAIIQKVESSRAAFGLDAHKTLNYKLSVKVSPELLAGVRVRIADYIFDGTVARNLIHWHDVAAVHPLDVSKAFID